MVLCVAALLVQAAQGAQGAPKVGPAEAPASVSATGSADDVVPSTPVKLGQTPDEPAMPLWVPPEVRWPQEQSRRVSVTPGTGPETVSVVSVADNGEGAKGAPAKSFDVAVKGRQVAEMVGGVGAVFSLGRVASPSSGGQVSVSVDTSGFAEAFGAGFASRVALFRVSGCAAAAVAAAEQLTDDCAADLAYVPSTVDPATGRLTATVPVAGQDETSGTGAWDDLSGSTATSSSTMLSTSSSTYTLASTTSGDEGNFSASPTTIAGSWAVGGSSGSFEYSYPLPSAASVVGDSPQFALGYSSASVDGMTRG